MIQDFYSHGKLLLTGEYVVLDGALSLAIPTKKGQSLKIQPLREKKIKWQSFLNDTSPWLDSTFALPLSLNTISHDPLQSRIRQILMQVQKLNPLVLNEGTFFINQLEFDRSWGLGSSSTLINNIARWAAVDPYVLLENTFRGSGYDIACAQANGPITYQLVQKKPVDLAVPFNPIFKEELFFVHLNRKQNSRESIQHYRNSGSHNLETAIVEISEITKSLISCRTMTDFEKLISTHEGIISDLIKTPTIKTQLFSDFPRAIKSLGGWGGDFILATGATPEKNYFRERGFATIIPYTEMAL